MKVNVLTEFPDRFRNLRAVTLAPFNSIPPGLAPTAALNPATARPGAGTRPAVKPPVEAAPYQIEATHWHKGQLLLRLVGVDSVEAVEALRGFWLLVPREQARKLPRGAYYLYQIVGLDVYSADRKYLGKVTDVLTTAANDIYIVRGPGVRDPSGELLVPAIKPVVKRIELKRGRIVILPPEEWS